MILTGKALENFRIWLDSDEDNLCGLDLFQLNSNLINALIIDWLDSIEIYILIDYIIDTFDVEIKDYRDHTKECKRYYIGEKVSRPEALEEAIIKVNEIYNNEKISE